jgi:hypothetical protein
MTPPDRSRALTALRLVLGFVVLWQSCVFVFGSRSAAGFAHLGLPDMLRIILGSCEIVAAVLFLVPATVALGGFALLAVFVFAVGLHALHGDLDVGGLLIYAAAVIAVLAHRRPRVDGRIV